ncbi:peroxin 7 [Epithele typhae]|uniref:peroxin 7 n=1 Tax=Epithele typhae TaxID=378194 RepID=UPI00200841B0|nr:peroxin 7 [Epithele typhae]KAH9913971.1 peroxin 7 [Epithele typhae]
MKQPQSATMHTPCFAHYGMTWSPFHNGRIAIASAANYYGLVGTYGRLPLAYLGSSPPETNSRFKDGLPYDAARSEIHENQPGGSGDRSTKLWDVMIKVYFPIRAWQEHSHEFVLSLWDGTVKLWTPERPRSLTALQAHTSCVYQAIFSPHQPDVTATFSTDGTFDLRAPAYMPATPGANVFAAPLTAPALTVPTSGGEVLSLDWNKFGTVAWSSMVRVRPRGNLQWEGYVCEMHLAGHEYAIRKVQWSPYRVNVLASAGYAKTCRIREVHTCLP